MRISYRTFEELFQDSERLKIVESGNNPAHKKAIQVKHEQLFSNYLFMKYSSEISESNFKNYLCLDNFLDYLRPDLNILQRMNLKSNVIKDRIKNSPLFFTFNFSPIQSTSDSDLNKILELKSIYNQIQFENQLKETPKEQLKEILEFNLRNFIRNGGAKENFINKLKEIKVTILDVFKKDIYYSFIENNDILNIESNSQDLEEINKNLQIANKLIGSINSSNTTSPVFHHIKGVLKEFGISPKEAREVMLDMKGTYSPNMNSNVIEPIISYLERINPDVEQKGTDKPDPAIQTKVLDIRNNFDSTDINQVYNYFEMELVERKYLSEKDLIAYLKCAFDKKEIPKASFQLKNAPTKQKVITVFYLYYKNIAGKPHGKQKQYAALLGNYFKGYTTKNVSTNFNK